MAHQDSHLSDSELLSATDGELSSRRLRVLKVHLAACSACQKRAAELDRVVANFTKGYFSTFTPPTPFEDCESAAYLKARISQQAAPNSYKAFTFWKWAAWVPVLAGLLFLTVKTLDGLHSPLETNVVPNPQLTPGESSVVSKSQVCQGSQPAEQRQIPEALRRAVLAEYGVKNAPQEAYEVDFLITPELGGSASIRNLWPQPYFSRTWNAHVKDALEDRLHKLVCNGDLDLSTAQREIATNWVDAYKKYIGPEKPM